MPRAMIILAALLMASATLAQPQLLDPDEARELVASADESAYKGADRLILFDRSVVEVEDSGLSHRFEHRLIKVLEPGGARALRALRFDYDPTSNDVQVLGVRIHRADSTTVDVDPADMVDTTAPASMIYWGARMKVLGIPALAPGDALESLAYTKGFLIAYLYADDEERFIPPMRGHFYDVVTFQGNQPFVEKSYELRLPKDKPLQYTVYNGEVASSLSFDEEHFVYRFWREDMPAIEREPRMPDLTDIAPKVVMATAEDWEAKSRWFYETNEWVFESNEDIDAKVREITRGLSEDEAIAALLHWVAQNIRYSGLTMGEGEGYTIHPSSMTFEDRCGVCKDIAGILVTMLRVAGFETYAAMTMAGARVEAVPADQFNHCVVALKKDDGDYLMLDPTWAPWNNPLWSRWEGEQHFVIGTPWGETRMMIPAFGPEENQMDVVSRAKLSADGNLEGSFTLTGKGIGDGSLRGVRANRPAKDMRRYLEGWMRRLSPRAELLDFKISDHRDFTIDTEIQLEYRVPNFATDLGADMRFVSPAMLLVAEFGTLNRLATAPDSEERTHPAFLWAPQTVVIDEELTLPKKYEAETPSDEESPGQAASASLDWKLDGRKLSLSASATLGRRLVEAKDWHEVYKARSMFADGAETEILLRGEGSK